MRVPCKDGGIDANHIGCGVINLHLKDDICQIRTRCQDPNNFAKTQGNQKSNVLIFMLKQVVLHKRIDQGLYGRF